MFIYSLNSNNLGNKHLSYTKLCEYKSTGHTYLEQELKDNTAKTCESHKNESLKRHRSL